MKIRHKLLLGLAGVAAVLGAAAYAWRAEIGVLAVRRMAQRALSANVVADLPDGLHVGLCGSGSPLPDATRAGPCVAVIAGRRLFIVDAGEGSARSLNLMGLSPALIEAVFLTHYHSDHIDGLGALMLQRWGSGAHVDPTPVYGPTGVEAVVDGFNAAYKLDSGYRVAHHGPKVVPPSGFGGVAHAFEMGDKARLVSVSKAPDVVLVDDGALKVTAFPVDHAPVEPAVGYTFEYKGRKLVISGDTARTARVESEAKGADVLVHEALSTRLVGVIGEAAKNAGRDNIAQIMHDIVSYHTAPEQAAEIAQAAGVRYLLLDHIVPQLPMEALEPAFLGDARNRFSGPLRLGHDGDLLSMPAGSTTVSLTNLLH